MKGDMRHYLNLTNGIEYLSLPEFKEIDFKFVRIQSTWLEQGRFDDIIRDLDYGFMIDGVTKGVIVYDTSAKKDIPRSVYQGLPFIKYAIDTLLGFPTDNPYVRTHNCRGYFNEVLAELSNVSVKRVRYLSRVLTHPQPFRYGSVTRSTDLDGNYDKYKEVLHAYQDKEWKEE